MMVCSLISIHALREEGDSVAFGQRHLLHDFYPRPPRGGRHSRFCATVPVNIISIHALREEGDKSHLPPLLHWKISIHALREEGDSKNRDKISIFL